MRISARSWCGVVGIPLAFRPGPLVRLGGITGTAHLVRAGMNQNNSRLGSGGVIDITTIGAKTGNERRIEINFIQLEGRFFITGRPGRRRDWQANLKANPAFTVHVEGERISDISAKARLITDTAEREDVLYRILTEGWDNHPDKAKHILSRWVSESPLIEFTIA